MGELESLDLSTNKLDGEIPSELTRLTFLAKLNHFLCDILILFDLELYIAFLRVVFPISFHIFNCYLCCCFFVFLFKLLMWLCILPIFF